MLFRGCLLLLTISKAAQGETIVFSDGEHANGFTEDTHIAAGSASSDNYSDENLLLVDTENGDFENNESRALISFSKAFGDRDGQLPAHALVEQAQLSLYIVNEGGTLSAHVIRESWDNNTVSWNSRGGEFGDWQSAGADPPSCDEVVSGSVQTPVNTTVTFDLTDAVQMWVEDPSTNHGILLVSDSTDGTDIVSSESTVFLKYRPTLTVTYTLGDAPDTAEDDTGTLGDAPDTAEDDTGAAGDRDGGCGCVAANSGPTAGWMIALLVAGWRRHQTR